MQQTSLGKWAHDIRNTLGTVGLYADALRRPDDARVSGLIAGMHTLLAQAAALCEQAVAQSRGDESAANRSGCDVAMIIARVRDLIAPTLPASCCIETAATARLRVHADPQDVFRILFNLAHNAAALARRGALRTIRIAAARNGAIAIITVTDDGPGLPAAVRKRLFRRGRSTTSCTAKRARRTFEERRLMQ